VLVNGFFPTQAKYTYSKFGIVVADEIVRANAKEFFNNVFLFAPAFNLSVDAYGTKEELLEIVTNTTD